MLKSNNGVLTHRGVKTDGTQQTAGRQSVLRRLLPRCASARSRRQKQSTRARDAHARIPSPLRSSIVYLMVLISKLALLFSGQGPILIEKIFFLRERRKDKTTHSSINVHWDGAQRLHCFCRAWEAVRKAGAALAWWACIRESASVCLCASVCVCACVLLREGERDNVSAAGCFVVARRPGGQQMSSCSPGLRASSPIDSFSRNAEQPASSPSA